MLDFRVYTFLEVCRHMNFTKAAEALHITQPAVSQHIRFIEEYYQTRLFTFQGKRPVLTEAGEYLPLIYCMGTSESAQAALKDGKLAALVEKPTEESAGKAAQAMEEVLAGRSPGSQTLPPRVLLGGAG